MTRWLAASFLSMAIAGFSAFEAFSTVHQIPGWCLGATALLALFFSLCAGSIAERLSRWRVPRSVAPRQARDGESAPVEGHAFGPTRRAPGTGAPCIAYRVLFLAQGGEIVAERADSALERVVARDRSEVVIQGTVRIDWACAASRALLRTDRDAADLQWPALNAAHVAVVSSIPRGGRVLVVGRARAEAHPTEHTGYRDLAPGLRVDGDPDLPITVFPLQGRSLRLWLTAGLFLVATSAAAAAPWWVLGVLRAR